MSDPLCSVHFNEVVLKRFKNMMMRLKETESANAPTAPVTVDGRPPRRNKREMDKVLLAFSGGMCSRALLHLVNECVGNAKRKKIFFDVSILFIDESAIYDKDDGGATLAQITSITQQHEFPLVVAKLEDVYQGDSTHSSRDQLRALLRGATTLSASEDVLQHTRQLLMHQVAVGLGRDRVLLGTSANRIAASIITSTARGRGGNAVPVDQSFSSSQGHFPTTFFRPMKDFLLKEIALYSRVNHLECVTIPTLGTMKGPKASIDLLTETFVERLQSEFPHTVHTLIKSAEKLLGATIEDNLGACPICLTPFTHAERRKAQLASRVPAAVDACSSNSSSCGSSCGSGDNASTGGCCGGNGCGGKSSPVPDASLASLRSVACYGCQITLKEMASPAPSAPPAMAQRAHRIMSKADMRREIGDYILEEAEDR
eukprot:TRINITY_DN9533_c0_g1_i4.p1 TRINITY_DN9533_c0_g1~~TRINITY_DN9533_c0_g1_i4.p1  ORF type:complete len:473 (+),score=105.97 TRINITY_DN9533_c0_g1_i4:133-1419(+)